MGKLDLQALSLQDISLAIAIEEHKTVSRAAEQLRISQSSASYGLEKLRRAFNDPIFLRRGSQMVMTERGKALVHYAQSALPQLEALTEPATFDPKRDKRHFCIAATGYEISSFFATTHKKLREVAPHISIQIEDVDAADSVEMLHKKWDILLTPMTPNSAGIMRRKLFEDHYVTFFDPEYQDAPNSIEAFAFMPHAVQSFQGNHYTNVDEALDGAGFSREKRLIVANFEHLPAMMRGTPLITTLPSRFKDDLFREFAYAKTPIELPDMSLYMCWSEARGHSAAHIWLREYLASIAVK